jgi:hypothetical protein
VWLDGNFDDLVAAEVEEKTDELYKYVNKIYFTSCNPYRAILFSHYMSHLQYIIGSL